MSATFKLFERWKTHKGFKSERQAALALGISAQAVNVWKDGKNGEPEYIEKMAHDLGEDPVKTILEAYAEQKKGASAKVLINLSKRFAAIVLVMLSITTAKTQAIDNVGYSDIAKNNTLYIMRRAVIMAMIYFCSKLSLKGVSKWIMNNTQPRPVFA